MGGVRLVGGRGGNRVAAVSYDFTFRDFGGSGSPLGSPVLLAHEGFNPFQLLRRKPFDPPKQVHVQHSMLLASSKNAFRGVRINRMKCSQVLFSTVLQARCLFYNISIDDVAAMPSQRLPGSVQYYLPTCWVVGDQFTSDKPQTYLVRDVGFKYIVPVVFGNPVIHFVGFEFFEAIPKSTRRIDQVNLVIKFEVYTSYIAVGKRNPVDAVVMPVSISCR